MKTDHKEKTIEWRVADLGVITGRYMPLSPIGVYVTPPSLEIAKAVNGITKVVDPCIKLSVAKIAPP
jgi:hypothetical protein